MEPGCRECEQLAEQLVQAESDGEEFCQEIATLKAENKRLRAACEEALPILEMDAEASHLTDGFGPRTVTFADRRLDRMRAALTPPTPTAEAR